MSEFFRIFIRATAAAFILSLLSVPSEAVTSKRTLKRTEDFVVFTGGDVPGLTGAEAADLRLYACRGARCGPVSFQVDKVDSSGIYVFPVDRYRDTGRDGTGLDDNDEMCFMAEDAGDRRPASWRPEGAVRGVELELHDPVDAGRAWVYLFEEPGSFQPDVPDNVDYVVEGDEVLIRSPRFTLGYREGRVDYDIMQMQNAEGRIGPDMLDKQKVGLMANLARHNLPINVPESIVKTRDTAIIDGPVRVIVEQMIFIYIADISFQYGSEYYMKFYRCGQNNSVFFKFPSGLSKLFKTLVFYWSLDFMPDVIGSRYIDPHHPAPITIGSGVVKQVPQDKVHYWWGLYGKNGALFQGLDLDEDMLPYFECHGLWNQDPEAKDKRGDQPGRIEIGLACREIESLPDKKDFHWFNYILFPAEPSLAGVNALKNIFEYPLKITARPLP